MTAITTPRAFVTNVTAVHDVHPRLRRITFSGGDLESFSPLGPDTFLYLLLPPAGHTELTIDRSFTWDSYREMPESRRPLGAYYSVRSWRPERHELDILVVLHQPPGSASAWAAQARVGDRVALWGPREAFTPPPETTTFLLVADETGLPAAAAIVESLAPDHRAVVVAEVARFEDRPSLVERDDVRVHWVCHDRADTAAFAHRVVDRVVDRVREVAPCSGNAYAWGGGESRTMTAVRRLLRRELGWPQESVALLPYWRHADDPNDPEEP